MASSTDNCKSDGNSVVKPARAKPSACVFVASLCATKSDDFLCVSVSNHFKQWGEPSTVKVLRDTANRPYAFVQYATDDECRAAIKNGHGSVLDGRPLRCEAAKVNRTLFINFLSVLATAAVKQKMAKFGDIEEVLPAAKSGVVGANSESACWYIKFVYRDDAIAAFACLTVDTKYEVSWAQNVEGARSPKSSFDKFSVFVGQLAPSITEEDLKGRFSRHGKIVDVSMIKKPTNTFAFIRFDQEASAARAVEVENHSMFMEKTIHVQYKEFHDHSKAKGYKSKFDRSSSIALAPPPVNVIKKGYDPKPQALKYRDANYEKYVPRFRPKAPSYDDKENAYRVKARPADDKSGKLFPLAQKKGPRPKMAEKRYNNTGVPYYYYVPEYPPESNGYGSYPASYYYPVSPSFVYYDEK